MSYGIPKEEEEARKKLFMPFQVAGKLLKISKPHCIFMKCMLAARGMVQTAEVIDGPQSVLFDQAENRLRAQKALLVYLMAPRRFAQIVSVGDVLDYDRGNALDLVLGVYEVPFLTWWLSPGRTFPTRRRTASRSGTPRSIPRSRSRGGTVPRSTLTSSSHGSASGPMSKPA